MFSEPQFITLVNNCLLPKLRRNFEEYDDKECFSKYQNELGRNIERVLCIIKDINREKLSPNAWASIFILFNELLTSGPWSNYDSIKLAFKLHDHFNTLTDVSLMTLLSNSKNEIDKQEVFDACMMKLHLKLTSEDFKMYPAQIETYCKIISNLKEYNVNSEPLNIMPLSLILIDDYVLENALNGLQSLLIILDLLKEEHFRNGNYYEVIYGTLKKSFHQKNKEVTQLILQCFLKLLPVLPAHTKMEKCDDVLANLLDELSLESNLYRKAICLKYFKKLIQIIGVDCVKRKQKTISVFCDNLDVCSNETVANILLKETLECIEEWIKYSWCAWRFQSDKNLYIHLMKLFITCKDANHLSVIKILLKTLSKLCTVDEQIKMKSDYHKILEHVKSENLIKDDVTKKNEITRFGMELKEIQ